MSAYFPAFRRSTPRNVVQEPSPSNVASSSADADKRWLANTSILIFPSPSTSTTPPTPASANANLPASPASQSISVAGTGSLSTFSIPTSLSIESSLESASERSAPLLRRIRLQRPPGPVEATTAHPTDAIPSESTNLRPNEGGEWRGLSRTFDIELESASEGTNEPEVEVWEWSQSSIPEASRHVFPTIYPNDSDLDIGYSHIELWASHIRERTNSQWTQFTSATNDTQLTRFSHSTPEKGRIIAQPSVHFPFLQTILKVLGIDEETVVLLGAQGHSTSLGSELFPSSPFDAEESNDQSFDENAEETTSRRSPIIALLTQPSGESSSHSIRAGLRAVAEYNETEGLLLTFPPRVPFGIQDVLLSPVKLTKSLASGTYDLTAGVVNYSSSAVGNVVGAITRPLWSAVATG